MLLIVIERSKDLFQSRPSVKFGESLTSVLHYISSPSPQYWNEHETNLDLVLI